MPAPPAKTEISDTYPNPSNGVARVGFAKLWETLFGTGGLLGSTGNPVDARTALGIGSAISFRNKLINGNFALNPRAWPSGAATSLANQYTLARWRVVTPGQAVTYAPSGNGRAIVAPAGGLEQPIEGANMEGGVYTLSWVGSGTAFVNGVAIANGGQTPALPANTNAVVRVVGAVSEVQFELGSVATPFERRPIGIELNLAQRYHRRITTASQLLLASGLAFSTTGAAFSFQFPVSMRAAPSLTSANLFVTNGAGTLVSPTGSAIGAGVDSALVQINVAGGLTVGQASLLYAGNGSGGLIDFDAEI